MGGNVYIYIAVMSLVSFAVRVLPLTLIRGQIKSPFKIGRASCRERV